MQIDHWLGEAQRTWVLLMDGFGPNGAYYVWLTLGLLGFFAWAWMSHRIIRKALGHRKWRGT